MSLEEETNKYNDITKQDIEDEEEIKTINLLKSELGKITSVQELQILIGNLSNTRKSYGRSLAMNRLIKSLMTNNLIPTKDYPGWGAMGLKAKDQVWNDCATLFDPKWPKEIRERVLSDILPPPRKGTGKFDVEIDFSPLPYKEVTLDSLLTSEPKKTEGKKGSKKGSLNSSSSSNNKKRPFEQDPETEKVVSLLSGVTQPLELELKNIVDGKGPNSTNNPLTDEYLKELVKKEKISNLKLAIDATKDPAFRQKIEEKIMEILFS